MRITEKLLESLPFDPVAFACGHLAPDSGLPNADWSTFDPPKEVTHYLKKGEGEGDIRDLDFYRTYLTGLRNEEDGEKYSFLWGYFFHLLCDNLWSKQIGKASKREFATLFAEQRAQGKDAFWILKDDWYGLDFLYLRDHPNSLFWKVFLPNPDPPSYVSFVPTSTLHHQLEYKRSFYTDTHDDLVLDRAYPYLNEATMNRFVEDCAASSLTIYTALQNDTDLKTRTTALAILEAGQIAPYPPPLGDTL